MSYLKKLFGYYLPQEDVNAELHINSFSADDKISFILEKVLFLIVQNKDLIERLEKLEEKISNEQI